MESLIAVDSQSPEWLAFRRTGLGGSDMSAIAGVNPYATAFDVWASKLGFVSDKDNAAMKWGRTLESVLLKEYQEQNPTRVVRANSRSFQSKDHPYCFYTPDGEIDDDGLFEGKTAGLRQSERWGEPGTDDIPQEYIVQCQWYLGHSKRSYCDVAVLIGGQDFRIYTVRFNEKLFNRLLELAQQFWFNNIVGGEQPDVRGASLVDEYLKTRFPENRQPLREATGDEYILILKLAELRDAIAPLEKEKESVENQLKISLGEAEGCEYNDYKITWRKAKDGAKTDWEAAFKALCKSENVATVTQKQLIGQHTDLKVGSRRFLITTPKKDGD